MWRDEVGLQRFRTTVDDGCSTAAAGCQKFIGMNLFEIIIQSVIYSYFNNLLARLNTCVMGCLAKWCGLP